MEYEVTILSPDPEEARRDLNLLAKQGWRLVAVAHEDRAILERPTHGPKPWLNGR